MGWTPAWRSQLRPEGCRLCAEGRPEDPRRGPRIFAGRCSDAYLSRAGIQRGWATVIWRGRHVVEPTELTSEEASAFFAEVLRVLQAMQAHYEPLTTNLQMLGNNSPHLHAILSMRFEDDLFPNQPIPPLRGELFPADELARDAIAIRTLLASTQLRDTL